MSTLGRSRPARPVANLYVTHPHLANTALTPRWHHPAFPFPFPWPLVPFPLAPWPFPLGPTALGPFPLDPCILTVRSKSRHREHYPLDQAEKSTTPTIKNVMLFRFSNIRYHYHYIHRQAEKLTTPHDKKYHVFDAAEISTSLSFCRHRSPPHPPLYAKLRRAT